MDNRALTTTFSVLALILSIAAAMLALFDAGSTIAIPLAALGVILSLTAMALKS